MKKIYLFFLLIVCSIIPGRVQAGWPIGKYRNIFVPNIGFYYASDSWDKDGKKIKAEPGNYFQSYSMNLYAGYGLSRRMDLIASLPIVYQTSHYQNQFSSGSSKGYGAADLEVGLSYNLINMGYEKYFSVQVSGIAPLYDKNSATGNIGYGAFGTEVKFSLAGNFPKRIIKNTYFNAEVFARRYFGGDGPWQLTGYAMMGFNISRHDQITVDAVYIKSISANKQFNANLTSIKDYELAKPALNFGHSFSRRVSVFAGGFYTVYGRNTATGYGGSLSTILKL